MIGPSSEAQILAHSVVVGEHVLISAEVEFWVVLGVLSEADGRVLVHNPSHLNYYALGEFLGITFELYYLDLGL